LTNKPLMCAVGLIVLGIGWLVAVGGFVLAARAEGKIDAAATALGVGVFAFMPALALLVGGIILARVGLRTAREMADIALERAILERLEARGQLYLPQIAAELRTNLDTLQAAVYRIAGKKLLAGYVNWQDQKLYSADAQVLSQKNECPNCGGKLELGGKGVIRCRYCGTEIFLPPD
jgi:hypothetical protein